VRSRAQHCKLRWRHSHRKRQKPAAFALALCKRLVWEASEGFATQYGKEIGGFLHASDPHNLMIQYHHL
jgi:hypothetical protein